MKTLIQKWQERTKRKDQEISSEISSEKLLENIENIRQEVYKATGEAYKSIIDLDNFEDFESIINDLFDKIKNPKIQKLIKTKESQYLETLQYFHPKQENKLRESNIKLMNEYIAKKIEELKEQKSQITDIDINNIHTNEGLDKCMDHFHYYINGANSTCHDIKKQAFGSKIGRSSEELNSLLTKLKTTFEKNKKIFGKFKQKLEENKKGEEEIETKENKSEEGKCSEITDETKKNAQEYNSQLAQRFNSLEKKIEVLEKFLKLEKVQTLEKYNKNFAEIIEKYNNFRKKIAPTSNEKIGYYDSSFRTSFDAMKRDLEKTKKNFEEEFNKGVTKKEGITKKEEWELTIYYNSLMACYNEIENAINDLDTSLKLAKYSHEINNLIFEYNQITHKSKSKTGVLTTSTINTNQTVALSQLTNLKTKIDSQLQIFQTEFEKIKIPEKLKLSHSIITNDYLSLIELIQNSETFLTKEKENRKNLTKIPTKPNRSSNSKPKVGEDSIDQEYDQILEKLREIFCNQNNLQNITQTKNKINSFIEKLKEKIIKLNKEKENSANSSQQNLTNIKTSNNESTEDLIKKYEMYIAGVEITKDIVEQKNSQREQEKNRILQTTSVVNTGNSKKDGNKQNPIQNPLPTPQTPRIPQTPRTTGAIQKATGATPRVTKGAIPKAMAMPRTKGVTPTKAIVTSRTGGYQRF